MKNNAKAKLITHSIIAVVLTIVLVWALGSNVSCGGNFSFWPTGCNVISLGGYTYDNADKYSVGEFTLDEEITSLDIDWIAGQVDLVVTDEVNVSAKETGADDDAEKLRYRVVDGKLMIKFKKSERMKFSDDFSKELTLYIPREMAENMELVSVQCVSAGLGIKEMNIDTVDIEMVSGKLNAEDVVIGNVNVESVSGDVVVKGSLDTLDAELVSGKINVNSDKQLSSLSMETVSGDITVTMPEGDGFTAEMDSVSGDMDIDFEVKTKGDKRIYGDGSADYSFETVSGDVKLKKAE